MQRGQGLLWWQHRNSAIGNSAARLRSDLQDISHEQLVSFDRNLCLPATTQLVLVVANQSPEFNPDHGQLTNF